jgi:hypothetical protein
MGFPGTWMTSSESVVYRVVPKCACSTIGQIMYYSDNGAFFDGDIHDAKGGMHKWAFDASQPLIEANVRGTNPTPSPACETPTPAYCRAFSTRSAASSATANAIAATSCRF